MNSFARIIAAAGQDRALHCGEDGGLVATGFDQGEGCVERVVCEFGRPRHMGDLRRALDQPEFADEIGGVGDLAETGQLIVDEARDASRHTMGVVFDPDLRPKQIHLAQQVAQVHCRVGVHPVDPDDDVLDVGCPLRLTQVGRAGE